MANAGEEADWACQRGRLAGTLYPPGDCPEGAGGGSERPLNLICNYWAVLFSLFIRISNWITNFQLEKIILCNFYFKYFCIFALIVGLLSPSILFEINLSCIIKLWKSIHQNVKLLFLDTLIIQIEEDFCHKQIKHYLSRGRSDRILAVGNQWDEQITLNWLQTQIQINAAWRN